MTTKTKKRLFSLLLDAVLFDKPELIVFDMKGARLENVVDVCMNGPAIQLTIRPVIKKSK